MDQERWRQIEKLYNAVLACEPEQRARLLDRADAGVRREVELMLAQEGSALDRPAWQGLTDATVTMLAAGKRLGRYEIEARVGAGGMGEVFRARDTRLNRIVALKVSKVQFSERFEREARAIAALNHPNICQLHDVGHHDGVDFLVMEYLEGETLASRLKKGALPMEQMIEYSIQMADALNKAHREGVTHRDLKPGNIMLTKSGAKLLDFGLAKGKRGAAVPGTPLSQIPTETDPLTARGTILGTLQYMAPEQLEGKEADARADIFAFGAVMYEMATGRRAFEGTSQASLMAKILGSDPAPIRSLEPMTSVSLDRLVRACLAKDPDQRVQSAQDVKLELGWMRDAARGPVESARAGTSAAWRRALPWALVGVTVLAFAAFAWLHGVGSRNAAEAEPMRFEIPLPKEPAQFRASLALSPDGRKLAFAAVGADGTSRIWIRDLNSPEMRPLAGTESVGALLIWSPDSQSVAFDSGGKLQRIDVSGGYAKTLCDLDKVVFSGSWGKDGVILFAGFGGAVMRVSSDGDVPRPVTALDTAHGDVAHTDPQFLPDGRHFLYLRDMETNGAISVGSLDAKPEEQDSRRLIEGVLGPAYVPSPGGDSGELLFLRGTALMAQRFDAERLTLLGSPVRAVDAPVGHIFDMGLYSVANNGTLAYRTEGNRQSQLTWFDEKGKPLTTVGPAAIYTSLALSPDGLQALVTRLEASGNHTVWLIDTSRGVSTPLANDPTTEYSQAAVWSADGHLMIFGMARSGEMADLYEKPVDGAGNGEELFHSGKFKLPLSRSPDGFLLFNVLGKGIELWALPVKEPAKAGPLLQGGPNYLEAQFSPDGHWVAYQSNESGRFEVYVKSFSEGRLGAGGRVSPNGGVAPRWSKDGKQLYYVRLDYQLMTMKLTLGTTVQAGEPAALFSSPRNPNPFPDWALSPDGKRFLFLAPQQPQDTPVTVVLNRKPPP